LSTAKEKPDLSIEGTDGAMMKDETMQFLPTFQENHK
jgi:hypothetical protein